MFGENLKVEETIELSNHQLVMVNTEDEIVSCLCLRTYPNIPALLPEVWPEVLQNAYKVRTMTPENSLFVHLFMWDQRYSVDLILHFLRSMYLCLSWLQYIVFVEMPGPKHAMTMLDELRNYFYKILPFNSSSLKGVQTLYVFNRNRQIPTLTVRLAVPEDNDDIVAMLDAQNPILRETYGEFYIADIILNTESSRNIIVTELNFEPIGMLGLNSEVSMMNLYVNFESGVYQNFGKHFKESTHRIIESDSDDQWINIPTIPQLMERIKSEIYHDRIHEDSLSLNDDDGLKKTSDADSLDYDEYMKDFHNAEMLSSTSTTSDDVTSYLQTSQNYSFIKKMEFHRGQVTAIFYMDTAEHSFERDAFLIELYAMHKDHDDRFALHLLQTAFEVHPNYTYALISVPTEHRYIPLLSYFVRVVPRPCKCDQTNSVLYALHKNALFSPFIVRRADRQDKPFVAQFLGRMHKSAYYAEEITDSIDQQDHEDGSFAFVVIVEQNICGVGILRGCTDWLRFTYLYNVCRYMSLSASQVQSRVGMLQLMILHPAFMLRLPFVTSEIFRLSGYTTILYKLYDTSPLHQHQLVNSMLVEMRPVLPAPPIHYQPNIYGMLPEHVLPPHGEPYSLHLQNVRLCTARRIPINLRMVLIGCSHTALAFLEHLMMSKRTTDWRFTSITLVSPNGMADFECDRFSELAQTFRFEGIFTPDYVRRLGLRAWVTTIFGRMTRINSAEKYVLIDGKRRLYYDRLYLFCGVQFDYPIKLKQPDRQPQNVLFIKSSMEAETMIVRVQIELQSQRPFAIIVYGDDRHCYTCIHTLLSLKVDPAFITFIRPRQKDTVGKTTIFNDPVIDEIMDEMLLRSGIQVFENYDVVNWVLSHNTVRSIYAESEYDIVNLPCNLFICFERPIMKRSTILILRQAGIMVDGRVIINAQCQTSQPAIYAAGPMTKFQGRLNMANWQMGFHNSRAVGRYQAKLVIDDLNPLRKQQLTDRILIGSIMKQSCRMTCATVLNGYYFMRLQTGGKPVPIELAETMSDYGVDLVTGYRGEDVQTMGMDNIQYCRINISTESQVHFIVTLTKFKPNVCKWEAVFNHHENIFLNMRMRFEAGLINDFFEFFNEPWAYVIQHHRYDAELLNPLHEMFYACDHQPDQDITMSIVNAIVANKWHSLSETERFRLVEMYMTSTLASKSNKQLQLFIAKHIDELPRTFSSPS